MLPQLARRLPVRWAPPLLQGFSSHRGVEEANRELESFFGELGQPDASAVPSSTGARVAGPGPGSLVASADGSRLTHVDERGRASMVDVSQKARVPRLAQASCLVRLGPRAFAAVRSNSVAKGDVLTVAQLAGIMAAKRTSDLIPLCHTLSLSKVDVALELDESQSAVCVRGVAKTVDGTGVEMEALTAVSVAALTVYDMCKAMAKDIVISDIQLDFKSGGKSGTYARPGLAPSDML